MLLMDDCFESVITSPTYYILRIVAPVVIDNSVYSLTLFGMTSCHLLRLETHKTDCLK